MSISVYSRRFLESSTTALLLRVDPLRVLALRELQQSSSYQLAKRNLLAVQWTGDILSKESEKSDNTLKDCEPSKLDRALFSALCSNVIWKPAVEELQNFLSSKATCTAWQIEFLSIDPDEFSRKMAGQLNGSFSYFSKGVHNEWVDRRRSMLNSNDCRTYAGRAIKNISFCAASLCCSTTVRHRFEMNQIIDQLSDIENEFGVF